ncbi:MAG: hypothetical protein SFW62_01145 [Alphaproteobacteria bacterium]|nr:hypothetical protein [Alphaproteobacteria bacterium]
MFSSAQKDESPSKNRGIEDIRDNVRRAKGTARDALGSVREDLSEAAHNAGHQVRELVDSAGKGLTQATQSVSKKVRANPLQSTLIALGLGFVVGTILRR